VLNGQKGFVEKRALGVQNSLNNSKATSKPHFHPR
jgi:hypothetical protein